MLNTLVYEIVEMTQKVSNRSIQVSVPNHNVITCADQERLPQVLINLLDNTIKYSAHDALVELIVEKQGSSALIHIRDRGVWIALVYQKRIFALLAMELHLEVDEVILMTNRMADNRRDRCRRIDLCSIG